MRWTTSARDKKNLRVVRDEPGKRGLWQLLHPWACSFHVPRMARRTHGYQNPSFANIDNLLAMCDPEAPNRRRGRPLVGDPRRGPETFAERAPRSCKVT